MIRFGTGGWRAIIGDDFIKSNILLVAQAIANLMKERNEVQKGIVIGYDRRFLSDKSAVWIAEVFAGNGIKVHFINKIAPTPLIMYAVKNMGSSYGMAVTASHNSADYNGIKVFTAGGRDADEKVTTKIEDIIKKLNHEDILAVPFNEAVKANIINIIHPFNNYIDTIIKMVDLDIIRKKELKILLDPMYGVSKTALQTILLTARCEVDIIHERHDTMFGGRLPSPSAVTLTELRNKVVEKEYDLGIGTDGDADRLGIIDENGSFIHPNKILALLYYYLLKYKGWSGGVVRNIATTHLLDAIADKFGEKCYEVPVGFKYISSKMEETKALIGGESSGGLTIRGHIKGKDGIFAATILVEMICKTGEKLGEMCDELENEFGKFYMVENNFEFSPGIKEKLKNTLYKDKKLPNFDFEIDKVSYLDGVKVYFKNGGWIIARFSGTEPLLRVFAEMNTMEAAEKISIQMKEMLKI